MLLLGRWLRAQVDVPPLRWIVVDDCDPPTNRISAGPSYQIEVIRPAWRWSRESTQAACLKAGLERVPEDAKLLIIEDDDCYLPNHISTTIKLLERYDLVGEKEARYYNVKTGKHRTLKCSGASLATTGMKGDALKLFRTVVENRKKAIDATLWNSFKGSKLATDHQNVVGIKGLPGRGGIGVGHRESFGSLDTSGVLARWIGEDRAKVYNRFRI